ncbi:MAG: PD40 domain-containing protein [Acidobacteria bacterium]|nr:PD40 domain-containing protein [Acidobacteriota bacterium]
MTPRPPARFYRVGSCQIDARRRQLWRDGEPVPLTAKTFDLLLFLVRRPNRVIEKAEFFAVLWRDTTVVEANLVRQVSLLRKALGQRSDSHDYIVTIPGRGYEFVADVEELEAEPPAAVQDEAAPPAMAQRPRPEGQDGPERQEGHGEPAAPRGEGAVAAASRSVWVGAMLTAVVVIAGISASALWWTSGLDRQASSAERVLRQVTYEEGSPREPSWSPDGRQIAFTSDKSGNADLWVQTLDAPGPRQLTTDSAQDTTPDWSPDGRWIVFRSERDGGGIFRISADGTREERVATFGFHPQWSRAGDLILFSGPTVRTGPRKFFVVEPDGGIPREVAVDIVARFTNAGTVKVGWLNSVTAAWHPDGRRVSFWGRAADGRWELVTTDVAGRRPTVSDIPAPAQEKLQREVAFSRFVWGPDGRHLYFEGEAAAATNIWRVAVNAATLAWLDLPERLTMSAGEERDLAIAPDGTSLAISIGSARTRLWAIDFDGRTGQIVGQGDVLTSGNAGEIDAEATRDGTKIAYRATRAGRNEVWELDTASRQERLLLASTGWRPSLPRWSPDGRLMAFNRGTLQERDARVADAISVLSPAEGRERLVSLPPGANMRPTDWSADGHTILGECHVAADQPMSVCGLRVDAAGESGSAMRMIATDPRLNLWVPRLSPDQRWVAFLAAGVVDAPTSQVFVTGVTGGAWIPVTDGQSFDDKPRWSPDGRTIYFISSREGVLNVWARRFDPAAGRPAGQPFRVTDFSGPERILPSQISRIEFAVTRDRLILPITEPASNLWVLEHADR